MISETLAYFDSKRSMIMERLTASRPSADSKSAPVWAKILDFCSRGKMLRGGLVYLGAQLGGGSGKESSISDAAAAMELFQAGLLAHDDIMDRDQSRRGAPTIHAGFAAEARAEGVVEAQHMGEALGMCLGDICFFEGFKLLAAAQGRMAQSSTAMLLTSEILSEVALAQMDDVRWGLALEEPREEDILAMYRGKTAHYTFSLPLALGALASGSQEVAEDCKKLGELLGTLFQIRDDELGLFGDEAQTGKQAGSDLREGKRTIFRARMLAADSGSDRAWLEALFAGKIDVSPTQLQRLKLLSQTLGVQDAFDRERSQAEARALSVAHRLAPRGGETAAILEGLVQYVSRRDK